MDSKKVNISNIKQLFQLYSKNDLKYVERKNDTLSNDVYLLMDSKNERYVIKVLRSYDNKPGS